MGKKRGKHGDVALRKRNLKKQQSLLRNELNGFREAKEEARADGYRDGLRDAREAVHESRTIGVARKRTDELLAGCEEAREEQAS